jgi:hypothetical protein
MVTLSNHKSNNGSGTVCKKFLLACYTAAHALEDARDDVCTQGLDVHIRPETSFETAVTGRTIPHIVHFVTEVLVNGYV